MDGALERMFKLKPLTLLSGMVHRVKWSEVTGITVSIIDMSFHTVFSAKGFFTIHNLHNTIMQSVLGSSLHKNNTSYLLLGLSHASVNRISIVFM